MEKFQIILTLSDKDELLEVIPELDSDLGYEGYQFSQGQMDGGRLSYHGVSLGLLFG
jgi:hypothetical protein